jgi:LPPG:FO 2-phospho-L-lactate transferase
MKVVALAGGVGGAKMAYGLAQLLPPENLTLVVNTGDDFEHLGLYISPDLDTVCYTLAGLADNESGWGRCEETFHMLDNIQKLGGPVWFRLGDRDLATHLERTRRIQKNHPLSQITHDFCTAWGVKHSVLPMSDQSIRTLVVTQEDGELAFQEYFVHRKCEPKVKGFRFAGIELAKPAPGVVEAIEQADALIICPSNPWVSIDPILGVPGLRDALVSKCVVAISPIIGGQTVKGPAAKMYSELGIQPSALAVASHYRKYLSGFVLDTIDQHLVNGFLIPTLATDILMRNLEDRRRLAQVVLDFIQTL